MGLARATAPLIVVESAPDRWRIMHAVYGFGEPIATAGFNNMADRRYEEVCQVQGTLADALKVLYRLEGDRGGSD